MVKRNESRSVYVIKITETRLLSTSLQDTPRLAR